MKIISGLAATLLVAVTMTACTSENRALPAADQSVFVGTLAASKASLQARTQVSSGQTASFLYILTDNCTEAGPTRTPCIKEYAAGQYTSPIRTIRKGLAAPQAMAFDKYSNLYVADGSDVTVYAPGKTSPSRKMPIGKGAAIALAFDSLGNLYVACIAFKSPTPYVVQFARGSTRAALVAGSRVIKAPHAIAVNRSNNVYVGGEGKVWVFGLGGGLARTVSNGVGVVSGLVFDVQNSLYVANLENSKPNGPGSVTKYKPNTSTLAKTITNGVLNPWALAISSTGSLYVASSCLASYSSSCSNWRVSVYAPQRAQKVKPSLQITQGIQNPKSIALDPNGDVFVANCGGCSKGNVTVYAAGSTTVQQTITVSRGAGGPRQVMFANK